MKTLPSFLLLALIVTLNAPSARAGLSKKIRRAGQRLSITSKRLSAEQARKPKSQAGQQRKHYETSRLQAKEAGRRSRVAELYLRREISATKKKLRKLNKEKNPDKIATATLETRIGALAALQAYHSAERRAKASEQRVHTARANRAEFDMIAEELGLNEPALLAALNENTNATLNTLHAQRMDSNANRGLIVRTPALQELENRIQQAIDERPEDQRDFYGETAPIKSPVRSAERARVAANRKDRKASELLIRRGVKSGKYQRARTRRNVAYAKRDRAVASAELARVRSGRMIYANKARKSSGEEARQYKAIAQTLALREVYLMTVQQYHSAKAAAFEISGDLQFAELDAARDATKAAFDSILKATRTLRNEHGKEVVTELESTLLGNPFNERRL
jgi:hypothetical protein